MHDWMKKNQKKLLAVIGAFLMVSFLVSVPVSSLTSGGKRKGPAIGKFGKTTFYEEDRRHAAQLWKLLEGSYSEPVRKALEEEIDKEVTQFGPRVIGMLESMGRIPRPNSEDEARNQLTQYRPEIVRFLQQMGRLPSTTGVPSSAT